VNDSALERSFRGLLERLEGERWTPIRLPDRFEPVKTRKATQLIERSLGEGEGKLPSAFDLDTAWKTICEKWVGMSQDLLNL